MSKTNPHRSFVSLLLALLSLPLVFSGGRLVPATRAQGPTVGSYELVSSQRLGRTLFQYEYHASYTNPGPGDQLNVIATLVGAGANVMIVDGVLEFGDVGAGETIRSRDTFTIQIDRRQPFDPAALQWDVRFDAPLEEPALEVAESDNRRLSGRIRFPRPHMWQVNAGGEEFTELEIPGIDPTLGEPGLPSVPVYRAFVAVPDGAKLRVESRLRELETLTVNLYPFQPAPVDQGAPVEPPPPETFENPPFLKNKDAYASQTPFPPRSVNVEMVGRMRDVHVAQIEVAAAQYLPAIQRLTLYDSVEFDVFFDGGEGVFVPQQAINPFELEATEGIAGRMVNSKAVLDFVGITLPRFTCIGEEFLILTHPMFRAAADELRDWKRSKGITTNVFEVNDGPGPGPDTRVQIDDFIEERYNECLVRPSYILLFGDSEHITPFYVVTASSSQTGTDYPYANNSDNIPADPLPDFAIGRIPVDTLDEAQIVVDKIIGYESSPPIFTASFFSQAAFAAQFQCCRTDVTDQGRTQRGFIEVSELARNALLSRGYGVQRIYTRTTAAAYTGDPTPRKYYNGTLLPAALGAGSGFPWSGSTTDIANAFNDGKFLIFHRDHGWRDGWVNPEFTKVNVTNNLSNGNLLPVVFSVNCGSAAFDNESAPPNTYGMEPLETYFSERLLRKADGGAVGVLGDTRDSNSWANNAMARGWFDAVWTNTLPSYGPTFSRRRLGDILNYGKVYVFTQVGVTQTAGSISQSLAVDEAYLYHVHGDPTLPMWTSRPFFLVTDVIAVLARTGIHIRYQIDGATVTASQEAGDGSVKPIGRAKIVNGQAFIDFFTEIDPKARLVLSASMDDAVSTELQFGTLLPDLVVSLDGPRVAVAGEDIGPALKIVVKNNGTATASGTVDDTGAIQPGGGYMVDVVLSTDAVVPPGFAPFQPNFVEDVLLQGGRVSRTPNLEAGAEFLLEPGPPRNIDVGQGVLPSDTPPGPYFLCSQIDPGGVTVELDEGNNVTCVPLVVEKGPTVNDLP